MAMAGLYRRVLPSPPAIDFSSSDGKQLFMEAIEGGTMEGFFKLISNFQTQSEPAYCGLATLAMVLNALSIDPGRKWKGPWRWFDESMLDCCEPLEKVKAEGFSFGKLVCLAHCSRAKVEAFRSTQSNVDDFRRHLITCSTSDDYHVIASYNRRTFKQTGSGHFSPIGGYHAGKDMVLILDVARFKYPPHWVPLTLLWEAMDTFDNTSGLHRGFMLISRLHRSPALLYTLSCKHESWIMIAKYLVEDVPTLLSSTDVKDVNNVLSIVFSSFPSKFLEFIKWVVEVRRREDGAQSVSSEEKERLATKEEILKQVQEIRLYKHVTDFLSTTNSCLRKETWLTDIAESVCCEGARYLERNGGSSFLNEFFCQETRVNRIKTDGDTPVTVVSGSVTNGIGIQQVDMLLPSSSSCIPASNDVLTVLLLALPPQTWVGIKDEKLLEEIRALVFIDNIPTLLQQEVMHLRSQLYILKRCKDGEIEEDFGAPVF